MLCYRLMYFSYDYSKLVNMKINTYFTDAMKATIEQNPNINSDSIERCRKCDGSGETQPNVICKRCEGTGIENQQDLLNDNLKQNI